MRIKIILTKIRENKIVRTYIPLTLLLAIVLSMFALGFAISFATATDMVSDFILTVPGKILGHTETAHAVSYVPSSEILTERELHRERIALLDGIFYLESTRGKYQSETCLKQGKVNSYGWKQSKTYHNCYNSHDEVRPLVEAWIAEMQSAGHSEGVILCRYNTGHWTEDCPYYQRYLTLK